MELKRMIALIILFISVTSLYAATISRTKPIALTPSAKTNTTQKKYSNIFSCSVYVYQSKVQFTRDYTG